MWMVTYVFPLFLLSYKKYVVSTIVDEFEIKSNFMQWYNINIYYVKILLKLDNKVLIYKFWICIVLGTKHL
jgi:hypothetical protein